MKILMFRIDHLWLSGQLLSEAIILVGSESLAWKRSVTERSEKFGFEATLKPFLIHPVFSCIQNRRSLELSLRCIPDAKQEKV